MAALSGGDIFRQAANQISGHITAIDLELYDKADQRALAELKRLVAEVRLDIRDFEYADTRAEAIKHAAAARQRLGKLRTLILQIAETGIFGPADVAQLTAQFDAVGDKLAVQ